MVTVIIMKRIFNIILLILVGISLFSSCKIADNAQSPSTISKTYNFNNNADTQKYKIRTFQGSEDSYKSIYVADAKNYKYLPDEIYKNKSTSTNTEKKQQVEPKKAKPVEEKVIEKQVVIQNTQTQPQTNQNYDKNFMQLSKQMQEIQNANDALRKELEAIKNAKPTVTEKVIVKEVNAAPTQEINIPNYDKNFADLMQKINEMQSANLALKNQLEEIKNSKPKTVEIVKNNNNLTEKVTNNNETYLLKEVSVEKAPQPKQMPIQQPAQQPIQPLKQENKDNVVNSDYNSNDLYALSPDEMATSKVTIDYDTRPITAPKPIPTPVISENKQTTLPWKNTTKPTPMPWKNTTIAPVLPWENQITYKKPVDIDYNFNKNINTKLISIFRGKLMLDNEYLQDIKANKYKCSFSFKDEQRKPLETTDIGNGYTLIESTNLGKVFLESVTCTLPYLPQLKPVTYYFTNLYFQPAPSYINYAGEVELFWVSNLDFPNQANQCCAVNKQPNFGGKIVPTFNNDVDALLSFLADGGVNIEVVNSFFNATRKVR